MLPLSLVQMGATLQDMGGKKIHKGVNNEGKQGQSKSTADWVGVHTT